MFIVLKGHDTSSFKVKLKKKDPLQLLEVKYLVVWGLFEYTTRKRAILWVFQKNNLNFTKLNMHIP
jgi:hypothetical protein